ncbi:MAG: VPLPA-CTERM sorting domain-containing protein [Gammaproteobacteria bacterium]
MLTRSFALSLAGFALLPSLASAATVSLGNTPGGDNVIFNNCNAGVGIGSGYTVQGCLESAHGKGVSISKPSSGELLTASGGQATVDTADQDGVIDANTFINIAFADNTGFTQLVLNIDAAANGTVTFAASPGSINFTPATVNLDKNGGNFITLLATTGEVFHGVSFTSNVNIADIKQIRIAAVPVPAAAWLMGSALLGLVDIGRRRKRA